MEVRRFRIYCQHSHKLFRSTQKLLRDPSILSIAKEKETARTSVNYIYIYFSMRINIMRFDIVNSIPSRITNIYSLVTLVQLRVH
jgi:hypothetical protein